MSISTPSRRRPPQRLSRPPLWAWPLAILLGFPIGGLIADVIVGPVDSFGAALAGGSDRRRRDRHSAVARTQAPRPVAVDRCDEYRNGRRPRRWCGSCRLRDRPGDLMLTGAVTGAGVGGLQALVFARQRISVRFAGGGQPTCVGALAWLVSLPTCLEQRRRAVHELRGQRCTAVRDPDGPSLEAPFQRAHGRPRRPIDVSTDRAAGDNRIKLHRCKL